MIEDAVAEPELVGQEYRRPRVIENISAFLGPMAVIGASVLGIGIALRRGELADVGGGMILGRGMIEMFMVLVETEMD